MPKAILDHGPVGSEFPAQTHILWDRGGNGIALGVVVPDPLLYDKDVPAESDPRQYLQDPRNAPDVGWYHSYNRAQLDQLLDTLHHVRRELDKAPAQGFDPSPVQDAPRPTTVNQYSNGGAGIPGDVAAELSPLDPAQGRPIVQCQQNEPHGEHAWIKGGPHGSQQHLYCAGFFFPGDDDKRV